jgi:hypothetical protein
MISACAQLREMSANLAAYYKLAGNVDCTASSGWNSGKGFDPVGDNSTSFTGTLDGSGNTIGGQAAVKISYDITDGGPLDQDGLTDGSFTDPSGPAILGASIKLLAVQCRHAHQ